MVSCSASGRQPHTCAHLYTPVHTHAYPWTYRQHYVGLVGLREGESELMKQGKTGAVEHGKNWEARNGVRIWFKYAHVLNSLKKKKKKG